MRHVEAKFEFRRIRIGAARTETMEETHTLHYFYNGRMRRRHLIKHRDERLVEAVSVRRADEYLFYADRQGDGPLVVTDIQVGPPAAGERMVPWELKAPYSIEYQDLRRLLSDPKFAVVKVTDDRQNERGVVKVEFRYAWEQDPQARFKHGTATLIPEYDWAVGEYDLETAGGFPRRAVIEYGDETDGFRPILRITKFYYPEHSDAFIAKEVTDFAVCCHKVIPDDFFSFAAVGLPEPDLRHSPSSAWWSWFWIANLGVVCILLGWLMRVRFRPGKEAADSRDADSVHP